MTEKLPEDSNKSQTIVSPGGIRQDINRLRFEAEMAERELDAAIERFSDLNEQLACAVSNMEAARRRFDAAKVALSASPMLPPATGNAQAGRG